MPDYFRIVVDTESLQRLYDSYGEGLTNKAVNVVNKYTNTVARESKRIINEYGYRDTGRFINSIKPSVKAYADRVQGEVNAGTKYAKVLHEGAKHPEGSDDTEPFFVSFRVAPSLLQWALRKNVIETIDGVYRLVSTGQVVNPDKGGLMVHIAPAKYFDSPYEKYKDRFADEISNIVNEI